MRKQKSVWFLILGLLVALAGCGGNGGSTMSGDDGDNTVDMTALNAAKSAAMVAYDAAKRAVAAVESNKDADVDSYNKAVMQRDAAKAANDKAQAATTVADAQKYRNMAQAANTEAMKYAGMVTNAASNVATKAAMALAAKIAPAIADPDGDGTLGENNSASAEVANDDLNHSSRPGKDGTVPTDDFTVMAGGIGTPPVISIGTDRLGMPDSSIPDNIEFVEKEGTDVGGFARNIHTRTQTTAGNKVVDKVTVLDNIDAAKNLAYREFYDDGTGSPVVRTDSASLSVAPYNRDAVTAITATGVLRIDTADIGGNHGLFSSTAFPSASSQTYIYVNDDASTPNMNEEKYGGRTLDGMFNGVPGKFSCSGGTCSAGTDDKGNLNALTGDWIFTPSAGDHMIAGGSHDNDYLAFGYWLQSTGEGDATAYKVGTFASGSMPFGTQIADGEIASAVSALTGDATYTGSAIGKFVTKTDIDGDNKGPVATGSGEFTAFTTLTAIFGGNANTAKRDMFTISGMVHDFVLTNNSDDTTINNNWVLNLQSAPFATREYDPVTGEVTDVDLSAHTNTFNGSTSGMEDGTAGRWEGGFYGPSPDTNPDEGGKNQYGTTNYPSGVAGEFIGHFEDGHAIGAFGATTKK